MQEAVRLCEELTGRKMKTTYVETNRIGDHIWWVSDVSKFQAHYPDWKLTKNVRDILAEILEYNLPRWKKEG
jgi:CDP-paratose 2-epimerase